MALRFQSRCLDHHVAVSLVETGFLRKAKVAPSTAWDDLPDPLAPAARSLVPLLAEHTARWDGDTLLVANEVAADLPGGIARQIGMPEPAPVYVNIGFQGAISTPGSRVITEWRETGLREIQPSRTGVQITWGGRIGRLAGAMFALVQAIDRFNATDTDCMDDRVTRWGELQEALARVNPDIVTTDQYTKGLAVYQAGSFALDVEMAPGRTDFAPILMSRTKSRSLDDNAPTADLDTDEEHPDELVDADADALLLPEDQKAFVRDFLRIPEDTKKAYVLRRNTYLVVDDDLRRALDVVKRVRRGTEEEKREFIKNPRTAIAVALGLDGGDALSTALFVETRQYSERVTGLGLWEKPELPWLSNAKTDWLPEKFPVVVEGAQVEVDRDEVTQLQEDVVAAEETGEQNVGFQGRQIGVATAKDVLQQIGIVASAAEEASHSADGSLAPTSEISSSPAPEPAPGGSGPIVVQIKTNFEDVAYEAKRRPRQPAIPLEPPAGRLLTAFKPHQVEGFKWLVDAWVAGWPGVLLADDMGLGKSFQALAFLAWIKAQGEAIRQRGSPVIAKRPTLIVAPTALLENWLKETDKHLAREALGRDVAQVFGPGIRKFKNTDPEALALGQTLDWQTLAKHNLVLTTYETLADHHKSFAKINCAVLLFDEMQKVKDPGTLNTWASKTLNADFVVGLTGTPVENRIEDLWSIMDRVFPSFLKDLKSFSEAYRDADTDKLHALSDLLMKPVDGAPALVLRRMKDEVLEGLPNKEVRPYQTEMPSEQAEAYGQIVSRAMSSDKRQARGSMLETIQKLRGISLFPGSPDGFDLSTVAGCEAWMGKSARVGRTIEILRDIERRREKALVFVEYRHMQGLLGQALSTLFEIERPLTINGGTPGAKRQGLVETFERRRHGFDLMVLSPKAAGVGLTIIAANHVIHLSRWWNPAVEDQCNDRVFRIGQERDVTIHLPMAVHPKIRDKTFDVTLDAMLDRKRAMSRNLLAPPVSDSDLSQIYEASLAA